MLLSPRLRESRVFRSKLRIVPSNITLSAMMFLASPPEILPIENTAGVTGLTLPRDERLQRANNFSGAYDCVVTQVGSSAV